MAVAAKESLREEQPWATCFAWHSPHDYVVTPTKDLTEPYAVATDGTDEAGEQKKTRLAATNRVIQSSL